MKVSVIVTVYKDIVALDLVIQSLKLQSYKEFEVVIAEDAQNQEMKEYVASINELDVKHTFHEDVGIRKPRSQNNAILKSTGEYLIFIDGDCIVSPRFVESHVVLAEKGCVLSGRRFNLNAVKTQLLRDKKIDVKKFVKHFWIYNLSQLFDRGARFEQGIYINPKSVVYSLLFRNRERNISIIGCNFSCFKNDMLMINGFDEGYGESGASDDMDVDWRFRAAGLKLKSCKNAANMFHLFHNSYPRHGIAENIAKMKKNEALGKYRCENGLNTH